MPVIPPKQTWHTLPAVDAWVKVRVKCAMPEKVPCGFNRDMTHTLGNEGEIFLPADRSGMGRSCYDDKDFGNDTYFIESSARKNFKRDKLMDDWTWSLAMFELAAEPGGPTDPRHVAILVGSVGDTERRELAEDGFAITTVRRANGNILYRFDGKPMQLDHIDDAVAHLGATSLNTCHCSDCKPT